jgi:hypothetical protein
LPKHRQSSRAPLVVLALLAGLALLSWFLLNAAPSREASAPSETTISEHFTPRAESPSSFAASERGSRIGAGHADAERQHDASMQRAPVDSRQAASTQAEVTLYFEISDHLSDAPLRLPEARLFERGQVVRRARSQQPGKVSIRVPVLDAEEDRANETYKLWILAEGYLPEEVPIDWYASPAEFEDARRAAEAAAEAASEAAARSEAGPAPEPPLGHSPSDPIHCRLIPGWVLRGRVLDPNGDPCPGVEVDGDVWDWTQSDAEGQYRVDVQVADLPLTLTLRKKGLGTARYTLTGIPTSRRLPDLRLRRGASLHGEIRYLDGRPIRHQSIIALREGPDDEQFAGNTRGESKLSPDGAFEIGGLKTGSYSLALSHSTKHPGFGTTIYREPVPVHRGAQVGAKSTIRVQELRMQLQVRKGLPELYAVLRARIPGFGHDFMTLARWSLNKARDVSYPLALPVGSKVRMQLGIHQYPIRVTELEITGEHGGLDWPIDIDADALLRPVQVVLRGPGAGGRTATGMATGAGRMAGQPSFLEDFSLRIEFSDVENAPDPSTPKNLRYTKPLQVTETGFVFQLPVGEHQVILRPQRSSASKRMPAGFVARSMQVRVPPAPIAVPQVTFALETAAGLRLLIEAPVSEAAERSLPSLIVRWENAPTDLPRDSLPQRPLLSRSQAAWIFKLSGQYLPGRQRFSLRLPGHAPIPFSAQLRAGEFVEQRVSLPR